MNKMPIISAYVQTGLRAFVSFFTTKAKAKGSKAKMEGKLHLGGSEIRFKNFFLTIQDIIWLFKFTAGAITGLLIAIPVAQLVQKMLLKMP